MRGEDFRLGTRPSEGVRGGTGDAFVLPLGAETYTVVKNNQTGGKAVPCDSARFQMAGRVSPPFLHRRVGFTSPSLPADLMGVFRVRLSGAGRSLPVP